MSELNDLIQFWKDGLSTYRLLMSLSTIYLVELTILRLEELKTLLGEQK